MDKPTTTAVCFCAAAKGLVVGAPMLEILYGGLGARERAVISLPIVLYQGEQMLSNLLPSLTAPSPFTSLREPYYQDICFQRSLLGDR